MHIVCVKWYCRRLIYWSYCGRHVLPCRKRTPRACGTTTWASSTCATSISASCFIVKAYTNTRYNRCRTTVTSTASPKQPKYSSTPPTSRPAVFIEAGTFRPWFPWTHRHAGVFLRCRWTNTSKTGSHTARIIMRFIIRSYGTTSAEEFSWYDQHTAPTAIGHAYSQRWERKA